MNPVARLSSAYLADGATRLVQLGGIHRLQASPIPANLVCLSSCVSSLLLYHFPQISELRVVCACCFGSYK